VDQNEYPIWNNYELKSILFRIRLLNVQFLTHCNYFWGFWKYLFS